MKIKALILLMAVTLASCHAEHRSLTARRKLGFLPSVGDIKDTIDKTVSGTKDLINEGIKLAGAELTKMKDKIGSDLKVAFKDLDVKAEALEALAQFNDEDVVNTLKKLKSFGDESTAGVKSLFSKIGDGVKKAGGKVITLGTQIDSKLKETCGATFAASQKKMMSSLESLYKDIDPNKLKDQVVNLDDLTIDDVSKVAADLKASTEQWTKWTKDSFMKQFDIPTSADITKIGCDGDCKEECLAVKDAAASVTTDMIDAVENGQKSLQNAFTREGAQSLGEEILSKMKGASDRVSAEIQMFCSATESIGDQVNRLKANAEKVVKNYQNKFCSSSAGKLAASSSSLLKCLFEKGKGNAILNSPIRKQTQSILKAVESVSCKGKNGRKVDFRPKRVFKNVKFNLDDAQKALLNTDPSALKTQLAEKVKTAFAGKAADVTISGLSLAGRRRLSGEAQGEMGVTMTSDEGFSVDVSQSSVVSSYEESSPSFSGGSDIEVSTMTELSEGSAKQMSMLVCSLLLAQVAFFRL